RLPNPQILNIVNDPAAITVVDNAGVAVGGVDGSCQENSRVNNSKNSKGKGKIDDQDSVHDKVPPDKSQFNNPQHTRNKNNDPNTGNDPYIPSRDNLDEYKEPDSEDDEDDSQSLGEGRNPGEDLANSYQVQKGPVLQTSNIDEIRDVTSKQGLSPRGRKMLKQNKNTSFSKPNTRARSRGC
ncbi:hypothetical protein EJD97_006286, partial [Solanum chilense]